MVIVTLGQPAVTFVGTLDTRFGIFHLDLHEIKSNGHFVHSCQGTLSTNMYAKFDSNERIARMCLTVQTIVRMYVIYMYAYGPMNNY